MKCHICGADMSAGNKFCLACGAKLEQEQPTPTLGALGASAVTEAPPAPVTTDPDPITPAATEPAAAAAGSPIPAIEPIAPIFLANPNTSQVPPASPGSSAPAPNPTKPVQRTAAPPKMPPSEQPVFFEDNLTPVVSIGSWLVSLLVVTFVPIILAVICGIIGGLVADATVTTILSFVPAAVTLALIIFWGLNSHANPSKRNFFRALLIYIGIILVLSVIAVLVLGNILSGFFAEMGISGIGEFFQIMSGSGI